MAAFPAAHSAATQASGKTREDRGGLVDGRGFEPRLLHRANLRRQSLVAVPGSGNLALVLAGHLGMSYAELVCASHFSFQRGASHPYELVERAQKLGYAALAITDECSLAGVVRAHVQARDCKLHLIIGSEI